MNDEYDEPNIKPVNNQRQPINENRDPVLEKRIEILKDKITAIRICLLTLTDKNKST